MKRFITKFMTTSMLALAGLTLISSSAKADTTNYNDGDLILAFRQAGSTQDYLLNIGQASSLPTSGSVTFSLGTIAVDLGGAFTNWYSATGSSAVEWSVFGTVVTGKPAGALNTYAQLYVGSSTADAFGTLNKNTAKAAFTAMKTVWGTYTNNASTANSAVGFLDDATTANSYSAYQGGVSSPGNSFKTWTDAETTVNQTLYLQSMIANSDDSITGSKITVPGSFSMSSNGDITYAAAVPEPSTYATLAIGAGFVAMALRRRTVKA